MIHLARSRFFPKFFVAVFALAAALFVSSCGKSKPVLKIGNWSYYMDMEVVRAFEKEFGVKIVYDEFPSNEELFTKLKAGGTGYDVIFPSGDYVSIMAKQGMLDKIDRSKIPNFKVLDPKVLAMIRFDAGNVYSVPYFLGAAGLVVNTAQIKTYEKSFTLFNRADLKNRLTLLDDMREVLGAALKLKGYSVNTTNPAELAEAKKIVLGWKKNIQKFDAESFGKSYAAGEFWAVHGYQENVFRELEGNDKLKATTVFFIPNEGGSMYMDNMAILKDSKNKELAHAFINYILEPSRFAKIADYLGLPSIPNAEAAKLVKKTPRYTLADLKNCEFKEDLGAALSLYDKVWQEIRVEN